MINIFEISGIIGLIILTIGVVIKKRQTQAIAFIVGGTSLAVYSIWIRNWIFIILQLVFIVFSIYEIIKLYLEKSHK